MPRHLIAGALALLLLTGHAMADEIHMVDGRKLIGKVVDDSGDVYTIKLKFGTIKVAKDEVLKIVKTKTTEPKKPDPKKPDPTKPDPKPEVADDEAVRKRAEGLIKLGERWVKVEKYKEAFREAAKEYNRANALLREKDLAGAAKVYQGALEIFPDLLPAKSALSYVFLKLGRAAEAIRLLKELVAAEPKIASSHYKLGQAYDVTGKPRTAFKSFEAAYKLNPRMVKALEAMLRIARDEKMRVRTELEQKLAKQIGVTLLSVFEPKLPDGYNLTITARDRRIYIKKKVVQGGKLYTQTQTSKYTGLQIQKATEYAYKVGQPEKISTDDFIKKNSRLKKKDVYPVWLDDWRQFGWAFDFNGSTAPRLRLMKLKLTKNGTEVRKPVGTLEVTCFSYTDLKYLRGLISGASVAQHSVIWREMRTDDWPVDQTLCLPFSKGSYVKVSMKLEDKTEIVTAFVYDHERGITKEYTPAEWKKARESNPRGGDTSKDVTERVVAIYMALREKMDAFVKKGDGVSSAVTRFLTGWNGKHGALRQESMDANMVVVLDDMLLLRDQYLRLLKGLAAPQKTFFIEEIEKALKLR